MKRLLAAAALAALFLACPKPAAPPAAPATAGSSTAAPASAPASAPDACAAACVQRDQMKAISIEAIEDHCRTECASK